MAKLASKTTAQPELTPEPVTTSTAAIAPPDIENLIADGILDDIKWTKVKEILIERARQKFWVWLSSQLLPIEPHTTALNEIDAIALSSSEVES